MSDTRVFNKRACKRCGFWEIDDTSTVLGECHRNSPNAFLSIDDFNYAAWWPSTNDIDWCGDFEAADGDDEP